MVFLSGCPGKRGGKWKGQVVVEKQGNCIWWSISKNTKGQRVCKVSVYAGQVCLVCHQVSVSGGPSDFSDRPTHLSCFAPVSAQPSPLSCQHMQWMAICLSSSSRMSKSRRGTMRGRDKWQGSESGLFLKAVSYPSIKRKKKTSVIVFGGEVKREGCGSE